MYKCTREKKALQNKSFSAILIFFFWAWLALDIAKHTFRR